ncbi:hypothetical protein GJ629_03070 [Halapricum sp. CBA1109]|uniref:hypothetical protein n=1 Tax=Halapricum sp. CBA1109 TaxID=2668068 RepID=UPI0012FBCD9E|nr:hypothetical protein [Halapricum sp. CBA1109]MUV88998.1 hypothetical protein [Halapricum sp. CBA1109]
MVDDMLGEKQPNVTRRTVLATGAGLGLAGLAGCTDAIDGLVDDAAAAAVRNRFATPAAFYGGDSRPEGSRVETDYDVTHVPITISGEREGLDSSVDLSAYVTTSRLRVANHNAGRSNRSIADDEDSDGDGIDDGAELAAYLDGEATIGERFVLSVPDARLGEDGDSLLDKLTPDRILQYLTGRADDSEGTVYSWGRDEPRLAATIEWPFPSGTTGPYNPNEQLLALGYKGRFSNVSSALDPSVRGEIDDDGDGNGTTDEGVYIANGTVSRGNGGGLYAWGDNRVQGESDASGTVVLPVAAKPEDCPVAMPALLYVRRVRHDDQYVVAGGWVVDDNALYHNAVTMLVAEGAPELNSVEHDRSVEEMRRTISSGLTRERSRLGSLVYDGELSERALSFLPAHHRGEAGREELAAQAATVVGERNPQTGREMQVALADGSVDADAESVQATVVSLDTPIVQVSLAAGCEDCEECNCVTNLVPAVNTISSR